jgi:hypothetical protein
VAREYKVGYGKPPERMRFGKGKSGNPQGRPKGTRNLKTDLREELQRWMVIREGGTERRVTKQQAVIIRQIADSVGGKTAAANLILTTIMRLFADDAEQATLPPSEEEHAALELLQERLQRRLGANSKASSDSEEK